MNQIATVIIVLAKMRFPFVHFLGRELGTHLQEGIKNKLVENTPKTQPKRESKISVSVKAEFVIMM